MLTISTHAPRTGSDYLNKEREQHAAISTHAPRTGSDEDVLSEIIRPNYFNPRSPHGERHGYAGIPQNPRMISTHAPRTGSDRRSAGHCHGKHHFNPRSPHGERQSDLLNASKPLRFQPTLPARGATVHVPIRSQLVRISTHAPRTGSDLISSGVRFSRRISTHAPRTGSDCTCAYTVAACPHFNPRSPHGERQRKVTILSIRIIGFAQKVYHKTVLLRISLAENAVILPKRPQNPVRTSLQKAGGLRFARAIRAARPYSISSPSGA